MNDLIDREATAKVLEGEMAQVCGALNAGTGRLVGLIARVLETEAWVGAGINWTAPSGERPRHEVGALQPGERAYSRS